MVEGKLDARTGADTTVEADADKLLATITLDVSKIVGVDMKDIRVFWTNGCQHI